MKYLQHQLPAFSSFAFVTEYQNGSDCYSQHNTNSFVLTFINGVFLWLHKKHARFSYSFQHVKRSVYSVSVLLSVSLPFDNICQRCRHDPCKHLRWRASIKAVKCGRKFLHLRCLRGFWPHLCVQKTSFSQIFRVNSIF